MTTFDYTGKTVLVTGSSRGIGAAILSAFVGEGFTANLLAPVVVHPQTGIGVQAVRNDARYSHRVTLEPACL